MQGPSCSTIAVRPSQPWTRATWAAGSGSGTGRSSAGRGTRHRPGRQWSRARYRAGPSPAPPDPACDPGRGERGEVLHQLPGPGRETRDGRQDPIEHRVGDLGQYPGPPDVVARRPDAVSDAEAAQPTPLGIRVPPGRVSRRLEQVVRWRRYDPQGGECRGASRVRRQVHERAGDQADTRLGGQPGEPPCSLRTSGRSGPTRPAR